MKLISSGAKRVGGWLVLLWFAVLLIGSIWGLIDYWLNPDSYRFPLEGFGWSYSGAMNYQLAMVIGIGFGVLGIAAARRALRSSHLYWLLGCVVAIVAWYFKPY